MSFKEIEALSFLDQRELALLTLISKQYESWILHPYLWKRVKIGGAYRHWKRCPTPIDQKYLSFMTHIISKREPKVRYKFIDDLFRKNKSTRKDNNSPATPF